MSEHSDIGLAAPAYGRFSRRVRAFVIDWIIVILLMVAALFDAVSANLDHIGCILGFTFLGVWLLYEPLLVTLTGSTIGHYVCNLRVVDDRTHGNVDFLKAVVRLVIKFVFGILSFIAMANASRNQAMHDLMTRSTVQMRAPSTANPYRCVAERKEFLSPAMPSWTRRILFILIYFIVRIFYIVIYWSAINILYACVVIILMGAGLISEFCIIANRCSATDNTKLAILGFLYVGSTMLLIIQGWRGRLYGARHPSRNGLRIDGAGSVC